MRIGITGHQRLADSSDWDWASGEIGRLVEFFPRPVVGITSLAIGADQMFGQIVLQNGGELEAVIPFPGYERTFATAADRDAYELLLNQAAKVEVLSKTGSDEQAYFDAGKRIVDSCDLLLALWNGEPAAGLGGTADVVGYAIQIGRKVTHLNPVTHSVIERSNADEASTNSR